jgi:hypothetical protein
MTHAQPVTYAGQRTPLAVQHGPRLLGGPYIDSRTARLVICGQGRVRVEPEPIPFAGLVATNLLIAAFFAAWIYGVYRLTQDADSRRLAWVAGVTIGTSTLGLLDLITVHAFRSAKRKGTWLVVDRPAGTAWLPRANRLVPLERLLRVELVTGRDSRGRARGDYVEEVHLILSAAPAPGVAPAPLADEDRVCLLAVAGVSGAYRRLCLQLAEHAKLPVRHVRERAFGTRGE